VSGERSNGADRLERSTAVTLTATGVTVLGVVLSIAATVAFGMQGPWWLRALVGVGVLVALVALIKLGSRSRRGPLARLANWVIGAPGE
jgi:hypothetical protein